VGSSRGSRCGNGNLLQSGGERPLAPCTVTNQRPKANSRGGRGKIGIRGQGDIGLMGGGSMRPQELLGIRVGTKRREKEKQVRHAKNGRRQSSWRSGWSKHRHRKLSNRKMNHIGHPWPMGGLQLSDAEENAMMPGERGENGWKLSKKKRRFKPI